MLRRRQAGFVQARGSTGTSSVNILQRVHTRQRLLFPTKAALIRVVDIPAQSPGEVRGQLREIQYWAVEGSECRPLVSLNT